MSTPEPQTLPYWMVLFAFIASAVWTILKILELALKLTRKPNLEIVLTREVFFRIFETGESLYTNVVLIAHESGALITNITSSLEMENGATKRFDMRVAQIGEKYRNADGCYLFSFHSSSPLSFTPENVPQRQVYICEYATYAEQTKQEFQKFHQNLFPLKTKMESFVSTSPDTTATALFRQDIILPKNWARKWND